MYVVDVRPDFFDPKLFVAGDCYNGPDLAVRAVADARKVAQSINQFLAGKGDLGTLPPEMFAAFKAGSRKEIDLLPVTKRMGNFNEVEQNCTKTEMITYSIYPP